MGVIDYKVFLVWSEDPDQKTEIHRLSMDIIKNPFSKLQEKLQVIFPDTHGKRLDISWKDGEGDCIRITNDEELSIAINEINEPIRKLYVTAYQNNHKTFPSASDASSVPKTKHPGVICDSCDKPVIGFRYKCLQCPDYDLCSNCEIKNLHAKHLMIRMPTPLHLRSHHEKRMFYIINKFMRKASSPTSDEDESKECPFKNRRYSSTSHSRHYDHDPQTPSWLNTFTTYLNDWANFPECPIMENGKKESEQEKNQGKSDKGSAASSSEKNSEEPHVELLKNIGETISHFLDPLGIDVNVQVKTDKTAETNNSTSTDNPASNNAKSTANRSSSKQSGVDQASESGSSTPRSQKGDATPDRKPSSSFTKEPSPAQNSESQGKKEETKLSNDNENLKTDDWTLLDTENIPTAPVETSDAASNTDAKKPSTTEDKPTEGSSIYPSLQNVTDTVWHSNPKIQRAVDAMMQMGFTNEGGWLTQLLVSKNGDISKVLDALQPTRN
ncbi:sequestosome-1 [Copidosoma floridanum]|uniref:sequestosome-1 n=1 Tax=Copidosoma floridanum TaxID=29053 RepID=UPI0006C945FF|nr:sequestosome-1 [Copidosoma floridanum]